jgi:hypothetical protein
MAAAADNTFALPLIGVLSLSSIEEAQLRHPLHYGVR